MLDLENIFWIINGMLISKWYHGECIQNLFPLWYCISCLQVTACCCFVLNSIWQSLNYVYVVLPSWNHLCDRFLKVAQPGFKIAPADKNFTPGQWRVTVISIANLDVQKKWFRPAVLDICEEAPYFLFSWYL